MKCLIITHPGIEDISLLEIKDLLGKKAVKKEGCVIFDTDKIEDLYLLCYKSQSARRVLLLLDEFKFKKPEDLKKITSIKIDKHLSKDQTFCVRSDIIDNEVSSKDIEPKAGEYIIENIKKSQKFQPKVDLEDPDKRFFIYIYKDQAYFGIDIAGFDLSKREYKIFIHPASIKGTIAYALIRLSSYTPKKNILDPFCGFATIPIEAALYTSKFPVNHFRKDKFRFKFDFDKEDKKISTEKANIFASDSQMRNIDNSKKNAKIAGIQKSIKFSKLDIEWLDSKFEREFIDCVVTHPPERSKYTNTKDLEKIYREFFYQMKFVLKQTGTIVLLTNAKDLLDKQAKMHDFKLTDERTVRSGQMERDILIFKKA